MNKSKPLSGITSSTMFQAHDSRHKSYFGSKPLEIAWNKKKVISWDSIQMWNAGTVLYDPKQHETDIHTINLMMYHADANVRLSNRKKWIKRIIDAHVTGSGYRSFMNGESTSWPKLNNSNCRSIEVNTLTDIIIKHRERVKEWKLNKDIPRVKDTPRVLSPQAAEVTESEVTESEVTIEESGVDNWEDITF